MRTSADDLLPRMRAAVEHASKATRFVQEASDAGAQAKDDRSPVTVADWSSQAVVCLSLPDDIAVVGEEDAGHLRAPGAATLRRRVADAVSHALGRRVGEDECLEAIDRGRADPSARFLTLDPVDGTKGFLRRQQYAISLALIEDGVVAAGVVGCPNLPTDGDDYSRADPNGCTAFAVRGGGAWIASGAETPRPLHASSWRGGMPVRACESVESGHSRQDLSSELLAALGEAGQPARLDSQCKYVVVARGGADIYMRLPVQADYREKIWDHAAGALIAEEAGAKVVDADGRPLDFSRGRELSANRGVFAGHPALVDRLVGLYGQLASR